MLTLLKPYLRLSRESASEKSAPCAPSSPLPPRIPLALLIRLKDLAEKNSKKFNTFPMGNYFLQVAWIFCIEIILGHQIQGIFNSGFAVQIAPGGYTIRWRYRAKIHANKTIQQIKLIQNYQVINQQCTKSNVIFLLEIRNWSFLSKKHLPYLKIKGYLFLYLKLYKLYLNCICLL